MSRFAVIEVEPYETFEAFKKVTIGCPLDTMTSDQMAKPHAMIGVWDYVNGTISGKMVYSDYGNFTLKIPNKTAFGDYK